MFYSDAKLSGILQYERETRKTISAVGPSTFKRINILAAPVAPETSQANSRLMCEYMVGHKYRTHEFQWHKLVNNAVYA